MILFARDRKEVPFLLQDASNILSHLKSIEYQDFDDIAQKFRNNGDRLSAFGPRGN